jgi:predicted DNA-binding transcriptional regulator YafY
MPSRAYNVFREAILNEKQVTCVYDGHARELCPVIIGRTDGVEKVLAYQVGGGSRSGLPPGGEWRCLTLSRVSDANMRDGPWREGSRHQTGQSCVKDVDLDINIHVRKRR